MILPDLTVTEIQKILREETPCGMGASEQETAEYEVLRRVELKVLQMSRSKRNFSKGI